MSTTAIAKSTQIAGTQLHEVKLVSLKEHKYSTGSPTEIINEQPTTALKPEQ